jgi:hypothetical protein
VRRRRCGSGRVDLPELGKDHGLARTAQAMVHRTVMGSGGPNGSVVAAVVA